MIHPAMSLAALASLLLATAPEPPDLGAKIQAELSRKVAQAADACADLGWLALGDGPPAEFTFDVAPTGKVKVGKPGPGDAFRTLYGLCVVEALAAPKVSVRGVTTQLTLPVPKPTARPDGWSWFADDPAALDRETIVATRRSSWVRCEHGDASLTYKLASEGFDASSKLAAAGAKADGPNAEAGPLWQAQWVAAGERRQTARRGALPDFARPLEQASGLQRLCAPVRKLGDRLPKLLEARAISLGHCLKHRHNELWLSLTLGADGAVDHADARATSGLDDRALDCLEKVARGWSFPFRGEGHPVVSAHLQAAPPGE